MIKLTRKPAPGYLSPSKVAALTAEYKATKAAVWSHDDIKDALLASSSSKCAYCESKLDESKYMEVEHFEDKDNNEEKVVEWRNLLPACKRCNGAKGTHDVLKAPIINPFDTDPRRHLGLRNYRLKGITGLGAETIGAVDLNNSDRLVAKRFEIGERIAAAIEVAVERLDRWAANGSTRSKNLMLGAIEGVLLECVANSEYSAIAATVLHKEDSYKSFRLELRAIGVWTKYLEDLHVKSRGLSLRVI